MRFTLLALPTALLTGVASAQAANCWGKALNAPLEGIEYTIKKMDEICTAEDQFYPNGDNPKFLWLQANRCEEVTCYKGTQVRWCNEDTVWDRDIAMQNIVDGVHVLLRECMHLVDGELTSGGMLSHPDQWSIILQGEDECKGKK
ncbi:uncharacterized protein APUU_80084S [Aspergillus puulaauensis]|uniref:Uncharacterized protein n=1 Tax=Aspergillus puulaauensis TaxID=1220207 RepID=A0A7R7XY27_9EURO|nr:uncharacterized protein APUU_80084S [Aspergillus puulaauensis]BCS29781.1 hypothetical protein APUU_80084S [Aspergillus puulaauensis]